MHVEMLDLEALDGERDGVLPLLQAVGIIDVDEGRLRPLLYGLLEKGLLRDHLHGQMDVLAVLQEDGLPEQDIGLIPYDDIALVTLDLSLIDLLDEAGQEVHVEGMLEADDEAKAIQAEVIEQVLDLGVSRVDLLLIPGDGLLGIGGAQLGLPLMELGTLFGELLHILVATEGRRDRQSLLTDLLKEVVVTLGEDPFRREVLLLQTLVLGTVRIAYTEADATPALVADIDRGVFGSIAQASPGVAWDVLLEEERYRLEVLTRTEAIGTEVQTGAEVAIALYATEGDTVAAGGATDEVVTPDAVLVEVLHGEVTLACVLTAEGYLPLLDRHVVGTDLVG